MANIIGFNKLCPPAFLYLVISLLAIFIMFFQNIGNVNLYCLGSYTCGVTSTSFIFMIKLLYVFFWTWLLNIICRSGYTTVSWVLVLLPFFMMFLLIALLFMYSLTDSK